MSTKNLRKMLDHYRCLTGAPFAPREVQLIDAIQELEAIERAAKEATTDEVARALRHAPESIREAFRLLESIAKESP